MKKIKSFSLGVSACLLGHEVRYDGTHRRLAIWPSLEAAGGEFTAICPEYSAGLGCPRLPAHLAGSLADPQFIITKTNVNVTGLITGYINAEIKAGSWDSLNGFILKARSPSCSRGPQSDDHPGPGLLALALRIRYPEKLIFDEEIFKNPGGVGMVLAAIKNRL